MKKCTQSLSYAAGTAGTVPYKVHIATGDVLGAGTSAEVFCVLHGSKGKSGRVKLENSSKNFERGRTDIFTVECDDIGKLVKMDLGHDNTVAFLTLNVQNFLTIAILRL